MLGVNKLFEVVLQCSEERVNKSVSGHLVVGITRKSYALHALVSRYNLRVF